MRKCLLITNYLVLSILLLSTNANVSAKSKAIAIAKAYAKASKTVSGVSLLPMDETF